MTDLLTQTDPIQAHDYRPGRANLAGQQVPDYILTLAGQVLDANLIARTSAGEFDDRPTEAHLAQLLEDEKAAQELEGIYLAELAEWHSRREWGAETAQEEVTEHF